MLFLYKNQSFLNDFCFLHTIREIEKAWVAKHIFSIKTKCCAHRANKRPKMASKQSNKPLLPTLKEKKRYVSYIIHAKESLPKQTGFQLVTELKKILGVFISAEAGLLAISYDEKTQKGVLRTTTKKLSEVRKALTLITQIKNIPVVVETTTTSGILKTAKLNAGLAIQKIQKVQTKI